ncbi:PqqD family protein [Alteromonas sediminis]|uniref:PqqD family protein n=1 Tax=Alteromonas sediminis TaxID=2259342 RepID=A0A3N5Y5R4_9ALTE|nr:PqqD family protein [Alteromonas sediminis]RPJ68526.1 PqqD family protein [Alteromonas sediminis]
MTSLPQRISLCESALVQSVSGEMVILDMESGQYYTLNTMATQILDWLKAGDSVPEVVSKVCAEYDATEQDVTRDVQAMISTLLEKKLVEPA